MRKLKYLTSLFILAALLVAAGGALASRGAFAPDLGSAASFVGLAHETFTNTGSGVYYGNVGVSPGTAVVGFPPGSVRNGAIYTGSDGVAVQAQIDANKAYIALAGQKCNVNLTDQDLGGMTLTPGVYCFNTSAQLTGDLVLDALDNPNAVWVFQIGSTLTTASGSSVSVINGGQALKVFWQVGSSATLGTTTRFRGNILAQVSVTLFTGAGLTGRAFGLTGAVTMDTNGSPPIANIPVTDLSIVKRVNRANAVSGQPITYTLTFANVGNELATGVMITDIVPISVTGTSVISSGVVITPVGGTRYGWNIAPLAAGQGGIITITGVLSSGLQVGEAFTNTAIITYALDSDASNNSSSVGVNVVAPMPDLSIVKRVNQANAVPGQIIIYTLTFANVGSELATGITITDIVPLSVTGTSVISSGVVITPVGGTRYEWNIAPLAVDQGGVITITGVLSSGLQVGEAFTNTAVITSALDRDASNNSSNVGINVVAPMPDLSIVKRVNQANVVPGQTITYTLTFSNVGNKLATGVTITDSIPLSVTGTSVISSGVVITAVGGTRYGWNIAPLAVGQGGVITITGVLSSGLQVGEAFTNTAVITSALDRDASNNSSSVGVNVAPMTYTLTVNIVGSGSVTREPSGTVILPSHIYLAGTVVTLTATPDMGWYFCGWSGDLSSATNPLLVTMNANKAVTAMFMKFRIYLPLVLKINN